MRFTNLAFPFNRLTRLLTSISVRTRIIVLALIPVVGFLANGLTYVSGEGDVGTAFETVKHSATLADASRDFKSAIAAMRIIVKDFSANPSDNLVVSFEQAHALALQSLDTIAASIDRGHAENIVGLRKDVDGLAQALSTNWCESRRPSASTRTSGLRRQSARSRQRGRAHHQREHDVAGRGGRRQIDDGAADHARSMKPNIGSIQSELTKQQFFASLQEIHRHVRPDRRHAGDEGRARAAR